jgi:hypothetical protein
MKEVSDYLHGRAISNFVEEERITETAASEVVSKSRKKNETKKIWNEQVEIRGIHISFINGKNLYIII